MTIRPNAEQFRELAAAPDDEPVVVLNLLKFMSRSDADAGTAGTEAYRTWGDREAGPERTVVVACSACPDRIADLGGR